MKKTLTIVALIMIITMLTLSGVKAVSSSTLADEIYAKLSKYGMSAADKVKIERNLGEVTAEQESQILGYVNEIASTMETDNLTNVKDLDSKGQEWIKIQIQEAAKVVGFTVNFNDGKVNVYNPQGVLVESVPLSDNGKLAYTGNNVNTILVVSSVAVIALAAAVVAKKTLSKVGA